MLVLEQTEAELFGAELQTAFHKVEKYNTTVSETEQRLIEC